MEAVFVFIHRELSLLGDESRKLVGFLQYSTIPT